MRPVPASPIDVSPDHSPRHRPFSWNYVPCLGLLRLEGELDLAGIGELRSALAAAEDQTRTLTVDLAGLDFIDCAALACILRHSRRMSRSGGRLVLEGHRGQVTRVLDLTGLSGGVERLSAGPGLRFTSGPCARPGPAASAEGAHGAL